MLDLEVNTRASDILTITTIMLKLSDFGIEIREKCNISSLH